MFRKGSPVSGVGKEPSDWLWGMPARCSLDAYGGGSTARPAPKEDLDFFTPCETWSGGKETVEHMKDVNNAHV